MNIFIIIYLLISMDQEAKVKYSSKISMDSKKSNRSSCRSLERPSWSSGDHSLNKNHSLIEVMSLESSKKSDLYEKILTTFVEQKQLKQKKVFGSGFNPFKNVYKNQQNENLRFSYESNKQINHICLCHLRCKGQTCPCFTAIDQECVQNLCCNECIQLKKRLKKEKKSIEQQKIFCTCKKTKCNKKYCSCFAAGIKCGIDCSCEDCLNCDVMDVQEKQPVCIVDDYIKGLKMPESMDFQPVEFSYDNI